MQQGKKMTAKEYLRDIHSYKRIVESLSDQVEAIRTEIEGVKAMQYDRDRVQTSPTNRLEELTVELLPELTRLEAEYIKELVRYRTELLKRFQQIANMDNPEYAEVLRLRYIDTDSKGKQFGWKEIAKQMAWSYSKVTHMHGYALQAFDKKYLQTNAN